MKYTIYSQCWYKPYLNHDFVDEITLFDPEGEGSEFCVIWYDVGDIKGPHARLEMFDDSWITLRNHPEFMELLYTLKDPTLTEFVAALKALGYEDDTPREK